MESWRLQNRGLHLVLSNKINLISFSLLLESDAKELGLNVPNGDCLKKMGGIAKLNKES